VALRKRLQQNATVARWLRERGRYPTLALALWADTSLANF